MSDDEVDGEIVKYEPPTQELMVEMRMKVTAPKMVASKLAEGIKRIIIKQWPACVVSLEEIQMVSVADADLAFNKAKDKEDEG